MTSTTKSFAITLDTHAPEAMAEFYVSRLGFEDAGVIAPGPMYETRELRHAEIGVTLRLRDCTPKPPMGTTVGTVWCFTMRVADPEKVAEGLPVQRREPAEGPADVIVVRDPGNYQVVLERA